MTTLRREILRKFVHLTELLVIGGYVFLSTLFSPRIGILGLTAVLLVLLEIEYIRLVYKPKIVDAIHTIASRLGILRPTERNNVTSAIFFVVSTIIAFSAFDYEIALLALLLTTFGDLAAALFGIALGKKRIFRKKTYVGSFAGLFMNILVGIVIMPEQPHIFLPMAFIATLVETLTHKLDDNLTVPLFSGFAGQLIIFFIAAS